MSFSHEKFDLTIEDVNLVCRACLSTSNDLKDMFDWGLVNDFYKITNIMIQTSETTSKSICISCEDMLLKCNKFRQQCEESNLILMDSAKKKCSSVQEQSVNNKGEDSQIRFIFEENKTTLVVNAPNQEEKLTYPCPYSCLGTFLKKTDLLNHLVKTHNKGNEHTVDIQFYCSFIDCSYNIDSRKNKYFLKRKQLNQHYNKVHKNKVACSQCNLKFTRTIDYERHLKVCNLTYWCQLCDKKYTTNERLMVHLMRVHPDFHKRYKKEKAEKRKSESLLNAKKTKIDDKSVDDVFNSPKRSFATQTLENIRNDVSLSWQPDIETKKDEISTQTVFEDLLSLKSQTSEDESIFCCETVSLSDIQTQTFPLEFGLMRSNKETLTSETQSPDLSIKETQTCLCLYESQQTRLNERVSPSSTVSFPNYISTETQTLEFDELLRFNSAETQTSEEGL